MGDPYQYVKLPDGSYGKFDANASDQYIRSSIEKDFPYAFKSQAAAYVSPTQMANQALSGTGIQVGDMSKPQPPNYNPGIVTRAVDALGGTLSAPQGTPGAAVEQLLSGNLQGAKQAYNNMQPPSLDRNFGTPSSVIAQGKSALGRIASGDIAGGVGELGAPALQALLLKRAGESVNVPPALKNLSKAQVSEAVTNGVNPVAQEMPQFRANVDQHLDSIINYAKENNLPLNNIRQVSEAAVKTGNAAHDFYMNEMVKPIANESIPVPRNANVGQLVGEGQSRVATAPEIVSRLKEINDTLYPRYQKEGGGGMAAQASIGSEQAAALRTEGAQLRDTLNNYMAKRYDMPVEDVAAIRNRMGGLRKLGEDMQYYSDETQHQLNALKNTPVRGDASASGYALQRSQLAYRNRFGTPADKAVANAIKNYQPMVSSSANPTLLNRTAAPVRTPSWFGATPTDISQMTGGVTEVNPQAQLQKSYSNRVYRVNQGTLDRGQILNPEEQWY